MYFFFNEIVILQQPGKLNMKDYTLVTDAISRMNLISGKEQYNRPYNSGNTYNYAPLATAENVDLGSEYSQVNIKNLNNFRNKYFYYFIIFLGERCSTWSLFI